MRVASVIPARTPRALFNSSASTVVLRRMRFMPLLCHVPGNSDLLRLQLVPWDVEVVRRDDPPVKCAHIDCGRQGAFRASRPSRPSVDQHVLRLPYGTLIFLKFGVRSLLKASTAMKPDAPRNEEGRAHG